MAAEDRTIARFDRAIRDLMHDALRLSLRTRETALFVLHAALWHRRAERIRARWRERGVGVPAFVIMSVTHRCNLRCKGCYARAQTRTPEPELTDAELLRVVDEAEGLGVSILMLAGGEPLTRPVVYDLAAHHPKMAMPIITNGLLLDEAAVARFRANRNLIPIVSIEGHVAETDTRRGAGVHARVLAALDRLRTGGLLYGASLTVTRNNYALVTSPSYVRELADKGCRVFILVEYVPIEPQTESLCLTQAQKAELSGRIEALQRAVPGLFVALPGDEDLYGGCMAAGRGFVHISAEGRLEPCPFAPFSDVSLRTTPLREALRSDFLRTIRESGAHLAETQGGCALWVHREWVQSLLAPPAEAVIDAASPDEQPISIASSTGTM